MDMSWGTEQSDKEVEAVFDTETKTKAKINLAILEQLSS